ncbi:hypothetical protein [Bradyrhizobium erythrophlei]|jgi:hypothetical protein|uniref:Uncharacterized protein n=1 Tax=Bradyrhizobium erythrophlei TaxID=1437360 RepID=A0A1M5QXL4_9BRAD|nr:hypothetical protein [Bradyrhizobium erythrophlei]SHH18658.1 hypothetical protein SAMN05444169_6211 [Bradyrhizobium erythrophlei]
MTSQAGRTRLIATVGHHPHLEHRDHLRYRQLSAMLLIVSSLLAIALIFATCGWRYGR